MMKLREFQEELRRRHINAALFLNSEQKQDLAIEYFAQTHIDYGALVVPARDTPFLLIPGFEYARIKHIAPIAVKEAKRRLLEDVRTHLGKITTIGVNEELLSLQEAKAVRATLKARLVPVAAIANELRLTKTDKEIIHIRKACAIGCEIINECIDRFGRFKTEKDVEVFLRKRTIDAGCTLSFPPIVASGPHAAFPHHLPGSKLCKGTVVLDFGVRLHGYCSDMTRTIAYGTPNNREREAYELLRDVQEWAVRRVKPGINFQKLQDDVSARLGPYKKYFIHRLGHSVGLHVHDVMTRAMIKKSVLREGMVWTVEPGIYVPGKFGMRIEDTVVVTEAGYEVLTARTPKEFITIRA